MPAAQRAAFVFAAAPLPRTARLAARLAGFNEPFVVAADGGATTALAFGYQPDVVIGDFDSLDAATYRELQARGVAVETHPRDKDATDGQLSVARALLVQPHQLVLLGFLGGPRLDHELANVLLLVGLETPAVMLDARNECLLVRPGVAHTWRTEPQEVVSLMPLGNDAQGVRTQGLRWPLAGDQLRLGDTRGVSNEPLASEASVSITGGLLLVTRHFPLTAEL